LQVEGAGDGAADLVADLAAPVQLGQLVALGADQFGAEPAGVAGAVAVGFAQGGADPFQAQLEQLPVHVGGVLVDLARLGQFVQPGQARLGDPGPGLRTPETSSCSAGT
jgi:hypothetical protein